VKIREIVARRAKTNLVALLLLGTLGAPSLSWADSGGVGVGGSGTSTTGTSTSGAQVQPGSGTSSATGHGVTVSAPISTMLSHRLHFTGTAKGARRGATVVIQRHDSHLGWVTVASGIVARNGSFSAVWRTTRSGRLAFRASVQAASSSRVRAASGAPTLQVTVYKPAIATLFGEGFYGTKTACGVTLRRNTLGVANRTLPCGTPVAIYWHRRTIVVPVIDRGPYANHADWDLTWATGAVLQMNSTETIGATAVPKSR
jgi:rare lipoprotein A (peptidoglycan hydrolase)